MKFEQDKDQSKVLKSASGYISLLILAVRRTYVIHDCSSVISAPGRCVEVDSDFFVLHSCHEEHHIFLITLPSFSFTIFIYFVT